jgi:hypothetical protein
MRIINLHAAADQIRQMCLDTPLGDEQPYFFVAGAGISYPHVPLASDIVRHCKDLAHQYNRVDEPAQNHPIDIYSHWFEKAYQQPIQRQKFLQQLIVGKNISPANFRLAHLLLSKKISNLVVTTNFDDFLSKALTLFGTQYLEWNHPKLVERIDPSDDNIQIIHVHGSYKFYDCCNLRAEIEGRAGEASMSYLLDLIFSRRLPLVIGYSGWEGDVIMQALRNRLRLSLPYSLYWFCYRQTDIDLLPDWLKNNPQVCFVALSRTGTLPATQIFDKLIQVFELALPEIITDPLSFFANSLRTFVLQDDKEDIYLMRSVIERIERARRWEMRQSRNTERRKKV